MKNTFEPVLKKGTKKYDEERAEALAAWREDAKVTEEKWKKDPAYEQHFEAHWQASETLLGPLTADSIAYYFKKNLRIRTKTARQDLIPFEVNDVQHKFNEVVASEYEALRPVRLVVLKARQFGISTDVQALFYMLLQRQRNTAGATVAHKSDATSNLYEMWKNYWRYSPNQPRIVKFNAHIVQMAHPSNSQMGLDTAENKEVKRSYTHQLVHASEVAFWPYAATTRLGLMQTIGDLPRTIVVEESTANGMGGAFYDLYWKAKKHENDYIALFYAWHEHAEYRIKLRPAQARDIMLDLNPEEKAGVERFKWDAEQIAWRRKAIADKCNGDINQFHQEYPSTDREAFLVSGSQVFDQNIVEARREQLDQHRLQFRGTIVYDPTASVTFKS